MNSEPIKIEIMREIIDILEGCYYLTIEIQENMQLLISNKNIYLNLDIEEKLTEEIKQKISTILINNIIKFVNSNNYKEPEFFIEYIPMREHYNNLKNLKIKNNSLIILFLQDFINISYCASIKEYIETAEQKKLYYFNNIKSSEVINKIYYRGNKLNFDLSPSLYRKDNLDLPKYEHIINNRVIQNMPNDFNGCENFFDKLTILKHFNCPSRLLDITENYLIAAFFALDNYYSNNSSSKYGIINFCMPNNNKEIKNSKNSDSVILLSALSTTDKLQKINISISAIINNLNYIMTDITFNSFDYYFPNMPIELKEKLRKIVDKLDSRIEPAEKRSLLRLLELFHIIEKYYRKEPLKEHENDIIINSLKRVIELLRNDKRLQKYNFYSELFHQAQNINPTIKEYQPEYIDVDNYYIVHPSLNNKRIINQQGLFIIIGASADKGKNFLCPNQDYLSLFKDSDMGYSGKRIAIIINNYNNDFYMKLNNSYGISKGFIYPDLEHKVNQIKNDVMFEYGIEEK